LEEIKEESDSDSDHFLMSSLSEAQLLDVKNEDHVGSTVKTEDKVCYVCMTLAWYAGCV